MIVRKFSSSTPISGSDSLLMTSGIILYTALPYKKINTFLPAVALNSLNFYFFYIYLPLVCKFAEFSIPPSKPPTTESDIQISRKTYLLLEVCSNWVMLLLEYGLEEILLQQNYDRLFCMSHQVLARWVGGKMKVYHSVINCLMQAYK